VDGIGCYVCSSFNGNNPKCEDPFNTTFPESEGEGEPVVDFYVADCKTGKKGKNGLFPASVCFKIKADYSNKERN